MKSNQVEKIFEQLLSIISQKKFPQFSALHTSRKIAYTKMYKDSKINQSILKSSWVSNLAKCMYVMCENNERYDCKMDIENNAIHVNPKHKWCRKSIECHSSQAESHD